MRKSTLMLGLALGLSFAAPAHALQCVPYARQISGIDLQGDAWRWWSAAQGVYDRGNTPQLGGVLVFKQTSSMRRGHVAVVRRIVNRREIRIDHANWGSSRTTGRGQVSLDVAVIDVSPHNDWSQVRVWHDPSDTYGARTNPAFGFIYAKSQPNRQRLEDAVMHATALPTPQPQPAIAPHVIHSVSVSTLATPAPTVAALQMPQPAAQPQAAAAPQAQVTAPPQPQVQVAAVTAAPQQQAAVKPAGASDLNAQVLARLRGAGFSVVTEPQSRVLQTVQPATKPGAKVTTVKTAGVKAASTKGATHKSAGKVIKVSATAASKNAKLKK